MYKGGYIAREAKATVPSASVWVEGKQGRGERYYEKAIAAAIRSHDPYQQMVGEWIIRRLSPDSNPIEIGDLPKERDEYALLQAMGKETANVHLGKRNRVKAILKHLNASRKNWLRRAGKQMTKLIEKEWKEYKKAG